MSGRTAPGAWLPRLEVVGTQLKLRDGSFVERSPGTTVLIDVTATDSGESPQPFTQTIVLNVLENLRPWQYQPQPNDSNVDGHVVPHDALRLINQLNDPTILDANLRLPRSRPFTSTLPYYDVNGDGFCTSNDVLRIINFLNSQQGEGEAEGRIRAAFSPAATFDLPGSPPSTSSPPT